MKLSFADLLATQRVTFRFVTVVWIASLCFISFSGILQASTIAPKASHRHATHLRRAIPSAEKPPAPKRVSARKRIAAHLTPPTQANPEPTPPQTQPHVPPSSKPAATGQPAQITLKNGLLTVTANDSDLNQILTEISNRSGMAIEGSIRGIRVFGIYGPDTSSSVLTDLLTGLGYNFMMIGATQNGPPRELQLTLRSQNTAPIPAPTPATLAPNHPDTAPEQEVPGPGAVTTVPPEPQNQQDRVQQNLQRLEQMRAPQRPPQ